jgi:glutaryl-CoA dehydrogenase
VLDECRIPETNRLPGAVGLGAPLAALNEARYGIVWGALGAAEACFDAVVDYAESRHQFGKPLGSFQITQLKLADMLTQLSAAQLLAYRLAALKDAGQLEAAQVSLGKRHNVRVALEIARAARAIHGANGISLEYPVFRHMVNLESVLTYEGTEDIHALVLGETITGIPAYR